MATFQLSTIMSTKMNQENHSSARKTPSFQNETENKKENESERKLSLVCAFQMTEMKLWIQTTSSNTNFPK